MTVDDILLKIAAIKYKELEIERMIDPKKVEEYYPEDPFEGLTDEQIQAILEEEEKFYESLEQEVKPNPLDNFVVLEAVIDISDTRQAIERCKDEAITQLLSNSSNFYKTAAMCGKDQHCFDLWHIYSLCNIKTDAEPEEYLESLYLRYRRRLKELAKDCIGDWSLIDWPHEYWDKGERDKLGERFLVCIKIDSYKFLDALADLNEELLNNLRSYILYKETV